MEGAHHEVQGARRSAGDQPLHAQQGLELPAVRGGEGGVARQGIGARAAPLEHRPHLAPAGDGEVEGGADALGGGGQAVPGAVAHEEHLVLHRGAQAVGDPVALIADRGHVEVAGQAHGGVLHVKARLEGAHAHPQLPVRREGPPVAGGDVAAVEPQLEVGAAAVGVDLQAAGEVGLGGLDGFARAQHPAPAQTVHDQGSASGPRGPCGSSGPSLPSTLAVSNSASPHCSQREAHSVGSRRSRRSRGAARRVVPNGRVHHEPVEGLANRALQAQVHEPVGGSGAGGGLALADLVAIEDEHPRARARELARHGEPGEARAADQHVALPAQTGALGASLGRSDRHGSADSTSDAGPGSPPGRADDLR